jgi:hypothetical protein
VLGINEPRFIDLQVVLIEKLPEGPDRVALKEAMGFIRAAS